MALPKVFRRVTMVGDKGTLRTAFGPAAGGGRGEAWTPGVVFASNGRIRVGTPAAGPTGVSAPEEAPAGPPSTRLTDGIRLAVATEETQRLERALAFSRAGLGALLLLVELVGALLWRPAGWLAIELLVLYAAQGLGVWIWLRRHDSTPGLRRALQGIDILWAAVLSLAVRRGPDARRGSRDLRRGRALGHASKRSRRRPS